MKNTLIILMSSCLLAIFASCGNGNRETTTTADSPQVTAPINNVNNPNRESTQRNGTNIICEACSQITLCTPQCENAVLACHFIDIDSFEQITLGNGYKGKGYSPKTVAQINSVLTNPIYDCRNHRFIIVGDHSDTTQNTDIQLKLIRLTEADKQRASPVSYTFTLFSKIIQQHEPTSIKFYKGRKDGYDDIIMRVVKQDGSTIHYDLSDIPPAAGMYDEVPFP